MITKQKILHIIAGPDGAGKTTLSTMLLQEQPEIRFINADLIAHGLNLSSRAGAEIEAGRLMLSAISKAIAEGESFGFETTLSGRVWQQYIELAKASDYRVVIIFASVNRVEICLERIAMRVRNGGHHVDEATVRRRYNRSREMFHNVYSKIADEWFVFDNSSNQSILVANKTDNSIEILDPILSKEFFKNA